MKTTLYVVRHGRAAYNVESRYLGALDPSLDEVGYQQGQELSQILRGKATILVCSPKLRACQTAEILANAWGLPYRSISYFAERNVGVYEGLTQKEARSAFPSLWEQNITRQWHIGPPDGESIKAVFERVATGLNVIRGDYAGQEIVLVAHGFVAKVIRALITPVTWEEFFAYELKNGHYAQYSLRKNILSHPVPTTFLSRIHLEAAGAAD